MNRLAICHSDEEDAFYLFHCDDLWQVIWDSWHETVEAGRLTCRWSGPACTYGGPAKAPAPAAEQQIVIRIGGDVETTVSRVQ